ncbi:MAG TPA: lamin tail domain-containing protein [Clostridia bacterium]|nr:lamin tail domain-containing protein [Clostridia bacterium]
MTDKELEKVEVTETPEGDAGLEGEFVREKKFVMNWRLLPVLAAALVLLTGVIVWALMAGTSKPGLVISEVCTSNKSVLEIEGVGTPDWVELYNGTNDTIVLTGFGLSNDLKHSYRFTFPKVSIGAGEYLLVYFTGGTYETDENPLCAGFGLSSDGAFVCLTGLSYRLYDSVTVPALESDQSYALQNDGSFVITDAPTPGRANE